MYRTPACFVRRPRTEPSEKSLIGSSIRFQQRNTLQLFRMQKSTYRQENLIEIAMLFVAVPEDDKFVEML